jgi:translation initiation factor 5B
VLGHVDHGKTSLLDAIRETRVVDKEAGAITQHIGATEVPVDAINSIAGPLIKKFGFQLKIPGLLFIDTPGHEVFTNLRKRGGSIADLAILVVDINQGIQPQTIEAVEILKAYKTPFIIALTKIDLLPFYDSKKGSFLDNYSKLEHREKIMFEEKLYTFVGNFFKNGFESELLDKCVFGKQVPIVPCSARTGEGLPELLALISGLSQKYLEKKLEISHAEKAKAVILESKEEKGLGKTIDVILYQGALNAGEEFIVLGKSGVIRTKARILLQPKALQEMRLTKEKFNSIKTAYAACGLKISATGLEGVLAGSTLMGSPSAEDETELISEIKEISFNSAGVGVIVKADAIGSLEAMVEMLKRENIPVKKAEIGVINRKDVVEAEAVSSQDKLLGCVIGFNVLVDEDAKKEAELKGISVFTEKVIYHLIDNYKKFIEDAKKAEKDAKLSCLIWPVEFELMKGMVFRNCKPAICGVRILEGKLRENWKVMNSKGKIIGKIVGIQREGKPVKEAHKGDELALSIDDGVFGRNIFEGEKLFSCIPAENICELQGLCNTGDLNLDEQELLETIIKKQGKNKSAEDAENNESAENSEN